MCALAALAVSVVLDVAVAEAVEVVRVALVVVAAEAVQDVRVVPAAVAADVKFSTFIYTFFLSPAETLCRGTSIDEVI